MPLNGQPFAPGKSILLLFQFIWRSRIMTWAEKVLLCKIAQACSDKSCCWYSSARLAEDIGCTKRTTVRLLDSLAKKGFIARIQGGRDTKTTYLLFHVPAYSNNKKGCHNVTLGGDTVSLCRCHNVTFGMTQCHLGGDTMLPPSEGINEVITEVINEEIKNRDDASGSKSQNQDAMDESSACCSGDHVLRWFVDKKDMISSAEQALKEFSGTESNLYQILNQLANRSIINAGPPPRKTDREKLQVADTSDETLRGVFEFVFDLEPWEPALQRVAESLERLPYYRTKKKRIKQHLQDQIPSRSSKDTPDVTAMDESSIEGYAETLRSIDMSLSREEALRQAREAVQGLKK